MSRVLIWDLPTRIFHWLLSAGFLAAAGIALVLGDDHQIFPYHAIIGLTLAFMVCLRVVWGIVGTRYARFSTFAYRPGSVIVYMKHTLLGGGKRYMGHNPGSAVAIYLLLAHVLAMAITGVMLGQGIEQVKELHELLAWVMLAVVFVHILGVAVHTIRHRENLTASMIHGKKLGESSDAIASAKPIVAIFFLLLVGAWVGVLVRNYNPATQVTTLPFIGTALQLGENDVDRSSHEKEDEREDD
ncbi:MAG: cytochrome b/b6 domain-containing protein [Phycisphaeraceae bacterium]|nr:cytochrome b/b6 domain-containing protein [Phycisphaeraceae bacterium]